MSYRQYKPDRVVTVDLSGIGAILNKLGHKIGIDDVDDTNLITELLDQSIGVEKGHSHEKNVSTLYSIFQKYNMHYDRTKNVSDLLDAIMTISYANGLAESSYFVNTITNRKVRIDVYYKRRTS